MKHNWKIKKCFSQIWEKLDKIAKGHFQKSQKLLAENLHERPPIQNIQ